MSRGSCLPELNLIPTNIIGYDFGICILPYQIRLPTNNSQSVASERANQLLAQMVNSCY